MFGDVEFKNIRSPYEVVKTVGFELDTINENGGEEKFKMRIDVVRFLQTGELAPMIWQLADAIGDVLLLHTAPTATDIRGKTVEEVIEAVLRSLTTPKPPAAETVLGD